MFEKLKEMREYEGLTQKEIAKKLKVKRATYAGWECGKDIIPLRKLNELANLFHTSLDYLVGTSPEIEMTTELKDIDKKTVSQNLKEFRNSNNLTQEQLANSINTS